MIQLSFFLASVNLRGNAVRFLENFTEVTLIWIAKEIADFAQAEGRIG